VDADDEVAARQAGADFVYKGAPPDELIATLTPLLRKNICDRDSHAVTDGGTTRIDP
jgi:DNA-binding response OmpR family regulator